MLDFIGTIVLTTVIILNINAFTNGLALSAVARLAIVIVAGAWAEAWRRRSLPPASLPIRACHFLGSAPSWQSRYLSPAPARGDFSGGTPQAGALEQNHFASRGERIGDGRIPVVERAGEVLETEG